LPTISKTEGVGNEVTKLDLRARSHGMQEHDWNGLQLALKCEFWVESPYTISKFPDLMCLV
jgi:hypothetical protein